MAEHCGHTYDHDLREPEPSDVTTECRRCGAELYITTTGEPQ